MDPITQHTLTVETGTFSIKTSLDILVFPLGDADHKTFVKGKVEAYMFYNPLFLKQYLHKSYGQIITSSPFYFDFCGLQMKAMQLW